MRDATPDLHSSDVDLVAEAACCPTGMCGPIFETSLVELVFKRLRLLAGRRYATPTIELGADPILDLVGSTAPSVPPTTVRPHEVASHD
jgi:hypothetical protein